VEHGQRIVIDPEVCGGRPIVAGVRDRQAPVRQGWAESAAGLADEEHADRHGFGNEGDADLAW